MVLNYLVAQNKLMNFIEVNSLPIKEVISDLAHAFNTDYEESCKEYVVKLPEIIGKGSIRGINFENGLGILIYNCTFINDVQIKFIVNEVHPLKFLYVLKGTLIHTFEDETSEHLIETYQSTIVASSRENGHILFFKANTKICMNSLEIDREQFQPKLDCEIKNSADGLKTLFKDTKASETFYHKGFYSLRNADLFKKIQEFEETGIVRKLFLEGIAFQVLTEQILEYIDDQKIEGKKSVLRQSEIQQIEKTVEFIKQNISENITVKSLAVEIGLNINKLQEGFKVLHQMTVNSFVQNMRMELAKDLLINTDYSISEIITKIGLSSKSYFSKMFKEQYDISPSEFRKKNKTVL